MVGWLLGQCKKLVLVWHLGYWLIFIYYCQLSRCLWQNSIPNIQDLGAKFHLCELGASRDRCMVFLQQGSMFLHLVLYVQQVVASYIQTVKLHNPPYMLQNKWVSKNEMNHCFFSWERPNLPKEHREKRTTSMSNTDWSGLKQSSATQTPYQMARAAQEEVRICVYHSIEMWQKGRSIWKIIKSTGLDISNMNKEWLEISRRDAWN